MTKIKSETKFLWLMIKDILLTPITLILILLKKKKLKDLLKPFYNIKEFILEPKFTITIIIINITLFFASIFFPEEFLNNLILFPSNLLNLNFLPLITSGFLHANLTHLIGNIIGIFIFGRIVERKLGPKKTFLIYFGALIIASLFTSIIHLFILKDNIGGLGASGALMGLVATAILLDPFYLTYELISPIPVMILGWLTILADIIGIINPVEDGIGHFAHLGGFISIALLAFLLNIEERSKLKKGLIINIISLIIGILIYFFIM